MRSGPPSNARNALDRSWRLRHHLIGNADIGRPRFFSIFGKRNIFEKKSGLQGSTCHKHFRYRSFMQTFASSKLQITNFPPVSAVPVIYSARNRGVRNHAGGPAVPPSGSQQRGHDRCDRTQHHVPRILTHERYAG